MFVPGVFTAVGWRNRLRWTGILIGGAAVSFAVEMTQALSGSRRIADMTDVLLNVGGITAGYFACATWVATWPMSGSGRRREQTNEVPAAERYLDQLPSFATPALVFQKGRPARGIRERQGVGARSGRRGGRRSSWA